MTEGPAVARPWIAAAVVLLLGLVGASSVSMERSLGWDESMHAGLPAARIALALEADAGREALDVVLDCQQYPPVHPLVLATTAGADEGAARRTGRWLWALGLFALFGLTRRVALRDAQHDPGDGRAAALAPWIALGLGLTSPLWMAYSGTLFLEGPFLTWAFLALWAWNRRDAVEGELSARPRFGRELVAGALIAIALFTKFNYGLLLGAGLALDLGVDVVSAARGGRLRSLVLRTLALALPVVLVCAWWFLLPWPAGADVAASHREALAGFLGGNQQLATTPYDRRLWDLATFFAPTPRMLAVWLVGLGFALTRLRSPGSRSLWLVLLTTAGPIVAHNFHLDRFLLGVAPALWPLVALGLARLVPARLDNPIQQRIALLAGLLVLVVAPGVDGRAFTSALGLRNDANAAYLDGLMAERASLDPDRLLPTAGLARSEHDALLDAIAAEAGAVERVAWLGIQSELSPAALHLGLLARGGSPERLRRDAGRVRPDGEPEMVVTFQAADPGWTSERLRSWAGAFDLVLSSEPLDWKGRRGREFLNVYRGWLFETGEWNHERLATVEVARPGGAPTQVELYACRRSGN